METSKMRLPLWRRTMFSNNIKRWSASFFDWWKVTAQSPNFLSAGGGFYGIAGERVAAIKAAATRMRSLMFITRLP